MVNLTDVQSCTKKKSFFEKKGLLQCSCSHAFQIKDLTINFSKPWTENWFLSSWKASTIRWQGVSEHSKPKLASENSFTKRVVGSKVNFKETRLKVSKFQKLNFCSHFLQKNEKNVVVFYFYPKDLKIKNNLYHIRYPLNDIIKWFYFFDSTHFRG